MYIVYVYYIHKKITRWDKCVIETGKFQFMYKIAGTMKTKIKLKTVRENIRAVNNQWHCEIYYTKRRIYMQ